jgi:hypothetical protein
MYARWLFLSTRPWAAGSAYFVPDVLRAKRRYLNALIM